ncbi:MAG: MmcQ/YjbR family DNA-binding protein [Paracoccaceae bacterium]|nr:MmcQ/YjbR family DNA-binding protein [Paracoccaceae bacterium]
MIAGWPELRALALSLDLPGVTEATSWNQPVLKAHGKLWTWWSPKVDAAVFKAGRDEAEMLHAADPVTFLLHPHYIGHGLILVAAGRLDAGWARSRLVSTWTAMAPMRVLKAWQAR